MGDHISRRYLARSRNYEVYSDWEEVSLRYIGPNKEPKRYKDQGDIHVTYHYGDPEGALILNDEYVIVSGYGLSIYNIKTKIDYRVGNEDPKNIIWTMGLHQCVPDDHKSEVRFVSFNEKNQTRVFKIDILTLEITELD